MKRIEDSLPVLDFLGARCFVTEEKSAVVTFSALIQNHCICRAFLWAELISMSDKSTQFVIATSYHLKGIPCCSGSMSLTNSTIPAFGASHNPNCCSRVCLHPLFLPLLRSLKPLLWIPSSSVKALIFSIPILTIFAFHSMVVFVVHVIVTFMTIIINDIPVQSCTTATIYWDVMVHHQLEWLCLWGILIYSTKTVDSKCQSQAFSTMDSPEFLSLEIQLQLPMPVGSKFCDFLRMISSLQLQKDGTI